MTSRCYKYAEGCQKLKWSYKYLLLFISNDTDIMHYVVYAINASGATSGYINNSLQAIQKLNCP